MAEAQAINATARVESRIRLAAALICAGLLVLLFTLIRIHPLAFVAFAVIGCPLVLAGILLFLFSIVSNAVVPPNFKTQVLAGPELVKTTTCWPSGFSKAACNMSPPLLCESMRCAPRLMNFE